MRCARCWRDTHDRRFRGTHWLCGVHRRAECAALVSGRREVTEYTLLRGLVFEFPATCARDEALTRANYVAEVWRAKEKPKSVLRAHRMLGRVGVTQPPTPLEILELVTEFISFIVRNAAAIAASALAHRMLLRTCETKVSEWYPALIRPTSIRELTRAERVVSMIRRETGRVLFFVRADIVLALNVPLDVAERIYVAYVALIATNATHVRLI